MKHQFPIRTCLIALVILVASCAKEKLPANPAPGNNGIPPKRTELSLVVQRWQSYSTGTYISVFTNIIANLNRSNGKVSVYADVNGEYKQLSDKPIDYAGGTLSASVSQFDLSLTFRGNPYSGPPQNLIIKIVVEN